MAATYKGEVVIMNPERKALWVEALLSGKYKQGRSELRSANSGYCCLGVACDLHSKHNPSPENKWNSMDCYHERSGDLSAKVYNWLGISTPYTGTTGNILLDIPKEIQSLYGIFEYESLISLNDNGVPFPIIAKLIQEQL